MKDGLISKAGKNRALLAAAAGYAALTIALTWPIAVKPHLYVVSEYLDASTAFYNLWWFHKALCELHVSPWTNPLLDYPYGVSMTLFPVWVPYDALALPVVEALGAEGLPAAYHLVAFVSFVACGLAGFVLARYLTRDPAASFVAGAALAFCPYRMWNITRIHAICLELVLFCIYFFLRTARERRAGPAAGFAITSTLLVYTSPPYAADAAIAALIALVFLAVTEKGTVMSRGFAKRFSAATVIILMLCSPYLIRFSMEMAEGTEPVAQTGQARAAFSANLAGFVLPSFNLTAYKPLTPGPGEAGGWANRAHGTMGYEVFIGYVVLALAAVGAALHAGSATLDPFMPYEWAGRVMPWLALERAPVRHFGVAMAALCILAGTGLARLRETMAGKKRALLVMAAGAAVIFEFNQVPLDLDRLPVPSFVYDIKRDPEPGSVLDLPQLPDIKRIGGWYHMHHGRPLVFQLASRGADPERARSPLFKHLEAPSKWLDLNEEQREDALIELRRAFFERDIRYVIVYKKFMEKDDVAGTREALSGLGPGRAMVDDEVHLVYRLEDISP